MNTLLGLEKYVVSVNGYKALLKYPDENFSRVKELTQEELVHLYYWVLNEYKFYERMANELLKTAREKLEFFNENCKFYTDEEMTNCGRNLSMLYDMERNNKNLLKEYNKWSGVSEQARLANDKSLKMFNLLHDMSHLEYQKNLGGKIND